jgi:2-polyprenyl-3-methyl-5-hydroxy-6-metoxy-1,4-benzoquinol methylase
MANLNKSQNADFYGEVVRRELLAFIPAQTRSWLDVGCGAGVTTRAIRDAGVPEVHGLEVNPAAAALARGRLAQVFEVDLDRDTIWQPPQRYDVVSFFDVLEHLQDPWEMLRRAQHWLNPGGRVIASLPNLRYWPVLKDLVFFKRFAYANHGVTDRTHLRFFTQSGTTALFEDSGYHVQSVAGINPAAPYGKARILFVLFPRHLEDTRYMQFVVVGTPAAAGLADAGAQGAGSGQ